QNITRLLVAQNELEWAVELLALIRQHPAIHPDNRDIDEQRLIQLQAQLAPDVFAAAVERGKARDLEASVKELIAAFNQPIEDPAQLAAFEAGKLVFDSLTEREQDILRLIAEGRSNREIADELVLAHSTVKWYI